MKSISIYLLCQLVFLGISEGAGIVTSAQELGEINLTFDFPIPTEFGPQCTSGYFSNGENEFWKDSGYMHLLGTSYEDYCEVFIISNTEIVIKLNQYANISKGYEIQFSDTFCKGCVYQLAKEIPYFSLENENWPFYYEINSTYTITPIIHYADQYTPMFNYSCNYNTLHLQTGGPSLELNSTIPGIRYSKVPNYVIVIEMRLQGISGFLKKKFASFYTAQNIVNNINQTEHSQSIKFWFNEEAFFYPGIAQFHYYTMTSGRRCSLNMFTQASLDLLGTDCYMYGNYNSIIVYPGVDNKLEYTNTIDFAAGLTTNKLLFFIYQQPISIIMQDNDMIYFWDMSKTNQLTINISSYQYYSFDILQVLSPEGCSYSDYLSDSYTHEYMFTDTAVCSPILFENPYLISIIQRFHQLSTDTLEIQLKVYSVSHQAISSSYKQMTGSLFLRFSENIVYPNTVDLKFPCSTLFFTNSSSIKLGSGCRIFATNKPRELELVFGEDTTLVKGDIVYLANSFCEDCTFAVEKRIPNITYTATSTTEFWNPDITHTVIADVESDSLEFGEILLYSFIFTEPADNGNKVTNYTITENKIEFEGLMASTFPYVLTMRGTVPNKFFYREKRVVFFTMAKENQLHCSLTYQINELLRVTFDNLVPYPDFPSGSEEWGCDLWFSVPSQEILGAGCKVLKFTDEGAQIKVKPGFDTTLKKGDTLYFLDSICAECNITIHQDLPTIRYEKITLPDVQVETLDQVKIYAENYCEEYKMNKNGNIIFPQTTCMKIDFTYEIINPNTGCSTLQLADNNDTYVNIDIQESDLCNVDYDYIFKMKMTLPSGFYREKEFPFYTPIRQKLDTEGVYLEEIGHVIFEFVGQFSDPPITDLTLLFDSATIDLLGDNPVISYYEGADNSLSIMDIVFGSNAKAQKGDQIVFLDSFCRSCSVTLTAENPNISCTGLENSYLNIAQPHTISCSISNYNIIEPNVFFYSDESGLDADCQLSLSNLIGLFKENLTFTANSLCLDKDYKVNVQLQIESSVVSKIIQFTTYNQEKQRLRVGEQKVDGTFYFEFSKPLEINSDTCSSINILSESTLSKLGNECAIQTTTGSYNLTIIPDPETTIANGEEITFTSEFCEGCKLTLTKDLPALTVNYNTSVYYNPTEEHVISATYNIVNSEEANGVINISALSYPICPAFAALNWGNYNQLTIPPNTLCGDNTEPYIIEITFTVEVNESPEPTFYRKKIIRFYDKETQSITNNIQKPLYYIFEMKFPITVDPTEEITCSDVLDTTTLNLFDATSCQLKVINESSFYLFPGSENNLQIGDNIKFQEEFCPSCQVMITELLGEFNVEPSDSPIWDISIDHTITPGITNYDQADAIIFKFNAIEPTSCTVKDLVISDTIISNPAAVLSTGYLDLCLELYKVNVTMELTTSDGYIFIRHKLISFSTYYQGYSNMEEADGSYLLEFGLDVIYPDESGNTWTCDSYWFKPEIIESLGDGCVVTNIDDRKISLTLGHNTTLQKGDQILFADSFCNGCKIDISANLPDFLLTTNEELPYWSPTKDYTITSTPINVIGNPIFSYIIEEPMDCNKEIILPDQEIVTISKDVLCVNLEYYILTAKMTLNGGFYREKQIKFITVPLSACNILISIYIIACSPLCLGCGANGGCEGCDTSYDHVKEIGSECRCADKWYYNTKNLICQSTNLIIYNFRCD